MGMMVMTGKGKGINFDRDAFSEACPFDVKCLDQPISNFLYKDDKNLVFTHEKDFTNDQKVLLIGGIRDGDMAERQSANFEDITPKEIENSIFGYYAQRARAMLLSDLFAREYGYPEDMFRSVLDYDNNVMLYIPAGFPYSEKADKRFRELTEEKFIEQLNEFVKNITGEDDKHELDICEEWWKE